MGINVNLMISLTFFVGGAFGGAAGALFGLNVGTVTPYVGFIPGVKAFTAAVLGGIGNVTGALLGGLTIGMLEAFLNGDAGLFPGARAALDRHFRLCHSDHHPDLPSRRLARRACGRESVR